LIYIISFVITIIDYTINNLWSVQTALEELNIKFITTNKFDEIERSSHIILPGVGSYKTAMEYIKKFKIDQALKKAVENNAKILGICLGMQLLASKGLEDGDTDGIGLINATIRKFNIEEKIFKVPHIGFNSVFSLNKGKLFKGLKNENDFYFLHSFIMPIEKYDEKIILHTCNYCEEYVAAFEFDNIYGTQFHPEKSQLNGLKIISNFYFNK